jgi:type II secretory ATPase GspE/PulE/Tfp pilus assembly ATPase PilB-like protein
MAIHELLEGTPAIKRLVKKEAPTDQIFAHAVKEEMTTLKQDGISKVLSGLTDMAEVRRVCIG